MPDPLDINRFVHAQKNVYERVLNELREGRKKTHWMWFIFPQLRGLGTSKRAMFYGISGLDEAESYLSHPVLGARLRECAQLLLKHHDRTAEEMLGEVDAQKLRSSATLFSQVPGADPVFGEVLDHFFGGVRGDAQT